MIIIRSFFEKRKIYLYNNFLMRTEENPNRNQNVCNLIISCNINYCVYACVRACVRARMCVLNMQNSLINMLALTGFFSNIRY